MRRRGAGRGPGAGHVDRRVATCSLDSTVDLRFELLSDTVHVRVHMCMSTCHYSCNMNERHAPRHDRHLTVRVTPDGLRPLTVDCRLTHAARDRERSDYTHRDRCERREPPSCAWPREQPVRGTTTLASPGPCIRPWAYSRTVRRLGLHRAARARPQKKRARTHVTPQSVYSHLQYGNSYASLSARALIGGIANIAR